MKVIFSFDYELFFGSESGSPQKSIVEPVTALAAVAADYSVPLCFFVDAGYLGALSKFGKTVATVREHENLVRQHLDTLTAAHHELLLHVHPHWEDSIWTTGGWSFDLSRYRLSDFNSDQILDIVGRYASELRPHTRSGRICAYRAGGWAVQPFSAIGRALAENNIFIDASVYAGGFDTTGMANFNFLATPNKEIWRFSNEPTVEDTSGHFLEVPTTSMPVAPAYYWRNAFSKFFGSADLTQFGDGAVRPVAMRNHYLDKLRKLFVTSQYCVTLDGMKASLALGEYRRLRKRGVGTLVLLSHPKVLTPFSIQCFRQLVQEIKRNGDEVVGYEQYASQIAESPKVHNFSK